jgi:hypothetical protein
MNEGSEGPAPRRMTFGHLIHFDDGSTADLEYEFPIRAGSHVVMVDLTKDQTIAIDLTELLRVAAEATG